MKKSQYFFPQNFYEAHLTIINDIHFTRSEIDVMSCIFNIMMMRAKKISDFLLIEPSTFYRHVANIMNKIDCHSQQAIIDFIRESEVQSLLIEYYYLLRKENPFENILKNKISRIESIKNEFPYFIQTREKNDFISHIQYHLRLAGIPVSVDVHFKEKNHIIFVLSASWDDEKILNHLQILKKEGNKIFFLLFTKIEKKNVQDLKDFEIIDFSNEENYYFSFIILLTKLLPNLDWEKIKIDFQNCWEKAPCTLLEPQNFVNKKRNKRYFFSLISKILLSHIFILKLLNNRNKISFIALCALILLSISFFGFSEDKIGKKEFITQDFILPKDEVFLPRPKLLKQIDYKFKEKVRDNNKKNKIVALIGQGGSGKTTLARQYAQQQKNSFSWEINAETPTSLRISFENFAKNLARTDTDKMILKNLLVIKEEQEQEEKIVLFVKERLKLQQNWLLIYDNVEKFADIQNHILTNEKTCGVGNIILTTRDSNIENNARIHHTIFVGELTAQQKFILFTNIMKNEKSSSMTDNQKEALNHFLEKIPPYPLDISVAAYYIKATNSSYNVYLDNIKICNKDFVSFEEDLLKEVGNYFRTRYNIIIISVQHIIDAHKDFRDLLLFISLLDPQNIPRAVLNNFKNTHIVDKFIFYLKKYSLLTSKTSSPTLSIHRSTQAITFLYLTQVLNFKNNKELFNIIFESFVDYIDTTIKEEDVHKMKTLIHPCETFLIHKELLDDKVEGIIKSKLGVIHFFAGNDIKSKKCLEESILKLQSSYNENSIHLAFAIGYLGNVERDIGNYEKAKLLLEQSLSIYNQCPQKDPSRYAYFFVYLSIVETYLGNYKIAESLLKKGLLVQKTYFPKNENYAAWVSGRQGILERIFGNYEKAEKLLEDALITFQKNKNDIDIAWAFQHLGVVYAKLGKYEKAKHAIMESLTFWVSLFPDEIGPSWIAAHISDQDNIEQTNNLLNKLLGIYNIHFHETYLEAAWHLGQLGLLYRDLGNYKKAQILLEHHKTVVEKNLGEDHLGIALILNNLGEIYILQGQLKIAENLIIKACSILEKHQHPNQYQCLENLSKLYLKKTSFFLKVGEEETFKKFREKSIISLNKALDVIKKHFPQNFTHKKRIQKNLTIVEKNN